MTTTNHTPPTTSPTVAHDSATCQLGPDGSKCQMCAWVERERENLRTLMERGASLDEARRRESSDCGFESRLNLQTTQQFSVKWQRPDTSEVLECHGLTADSLAFRIRAAIRSYGSVELLDLTPTKDGYAAVEQSAATIRARRAALLERVAPDAPTEGALALAEAWLDSEDWYQRLPNNAMQDAAVLELAGEIESAVGSWLSEVAQLKSALQKILDNDDECGCEHDNANCCELNHVFCPRCIAARALMEKLVDGK